MKKVGIVSCYFKHNYGSMLQAYATQKALDKLGYCNETIDVSNINNEIRIAKIKYFAKASITSGILLTKFGMVKNVIIKKMAKNDYISSLKLRDDKFEQFKRKYFVLSEKYANKKELGEKTKEKYSTVIVGSDQLWLPVNIAADYYTLNFVDKSVNTIAYSTSFGQSSLPKDSSKKAAIFLKKIKHISVREESGQQLVNELSGRNVPVVCDPTILFNGDEWMDIQSVEPLYNEKYIFCYFLGKNKIHRDFVKKLKQKTGAKIIAIIHLDEYIPSDNGYADYTPYDVGPSEFLNLIRNAEYVCTDSFHCSVFSILYKKKFFSFRRFSSHSKQSTNSRLDTLFKITGVEGRLIDGTEEINKCLEITTDYDMIHDRLNEIRKKSYGYLKRALIDEESTDF